jgi:hypothetical protein
VKTKGYNVDKKSGGYNIDRAIRYDSTGLFLYYLSPRLTVKTKGYNVDKKSGGYNIDRAILI